MCVVKIKVWMRQNWFVLLDYFKLRKYQICQRPDIILCTVKFFILNKTLQNSKVIKRMWVNTVMVIDCYTVYKVNETDPCWLFWYPDIGAWTYDTLATISVDERLTIHGSGSITVAYIQIQVKGWGRKCVGFVCPLVDVNRGMKQYFTDIVKNKPKKTTFAWLYHQ